MKLTSLSIEQFRQFREPFVLDALGEGINLITGPNESGKSTLVQAIRSVFFEKYKSSKMEHLQPWGDSSAAPAVTVMFETGGESWQLSKRYLKQKRCDLQIGVASFSNEEAEEKVAALLGFEYASKGASKAEHWGVPGLLWVEQGSGQSVDTPVTHAGGHLQSALNSLVGEVASSGGDAVIAQVEKLRNELLTKAGKPRADFEAVLDRCDTLREQFEMVEQRVRAYQDTVDRLAELDEIHTSAEQAHPWLEQQQKATQAEQKLEQIRKLQSKQEQNRTLLQQQEATLQSLQLQQEGADKKVSELDRRAQEKNDTEQALESLKAREQVYTDTLQQAEEAYQAAAQSLQAARDYEKYHALKSRHAQLGQTLQSQQSALEEAEKLQGELQAARDSLRGNAIEPAQLAELLETEAKCNEARIQLEAIATRINYDLQHGVSISIDGDVMQGEGSQLLVDGVKLKVPGIGSLEIIPGGSDINELRREEQKRRETLSRQLEALNVASVDEARERNAHREKAQQTIANTEAQLRAHAPQGLDALREQNSEAREASHALAAQLQALPEPTPVALSASEAEAARDTAGEVLKEREDQQTDFRIKLGKADSEQKSARREWSTLNEELQSEAFQQQLKLLGKQLEESLSAIEAQRAEISERQQEINAAQPELLEQDLLRFRKSAEIQQKEHQAQAIEIGRLRERLESEGAQGLEEKRDELAAQLAQAERRREELQGRADALDLLLNLLQKHRSELTRRLQAPLQTRLDHYLGILFPDAKLSVNEQLIPQLFSRSGEHGEFGELSYGAREQMGLISRLAYADLLKEAERPTLIILDDTLVHSDRKRLEPMKRVLFDAAQRHQILLFTCHPENWQDMGVPARDLTVLKSGNT